MSVTIQHPDLLLLIPVAIVITAFLVRKTFVKMLTKEQQKSYVKSKRGLRLAVLLLRSLIFTLLIVALANPYTIDSREVSGSPRLSIFVDESSSMELFDTSVVQDIRDAAQNRVPVTVRTIASENHSNLGDAIINYAQGDDSILLVSDGNAHYGRQLGDVLLFATKLNTTISALRLSPQHHDALVRVDGPARTTRGVATEFLAVVEGTAGFEQRTLTVTVDGSEVLRTQVSSATQQRFTVSLSEGYHQVIARLDGADYFPQNNIFYKVVKVEPKPRILLVTDGGPLQTVFSDLYELSAVGSVPASLDSYSAVVLENVPASAIPTSTLVDYVTDGNGLVVVGGPRAYDRGSYKDSVFESLLPVVVGTGEQQQSKDVNVVILLDISGSSTSRVPGTTLTQAELTKTLAFNLIDSLKPTDNVAVIAFHTKQILVSPLTALSQNEEQLKEKVSTIVGQSGSGTLIGEGIAAARQILAPLDGTKSIVLISDGLPGSPPADDIRAAGIASRQGTKVYAIQVGEDANGAQHLQDIAQAGTGVYFSADEQSRLKLAFGEPDETEPSNSLEIVNGYHFITRGLSLAGDISGYNQVVPKSNANLLVSTASSTPILSTWRFGLGRVAAVSTDDGSAWGAALVSQQNSKLLSKTVNWAVGDLSRNKQFDVRMQDSFVGDDVEVQVISSALPEHESMSFSKVGERLYVSSFAPTEPGFETVFNGAVAVNAPREFAKVGLNPDLAGLVLLSNGEMFSPQDTDAIIDKVIADSRRVQTTQVSYSYLPAIAALLLFLLEVAIRKIIEKKSLNS